ncbi:MAG: hypothetical protein ACFFCW_21770 [Candidatus Hodarchaeota archaeon]
MQRLVREADEHLKHQFRHALIRQEADRGHCTNVEEARCQYKGITDADSGVTPTINT